MKTFHKVLLVALIATFSFGYASADFRFGIKAGLNFTKLSLKTGQSAAEAMDGSKTGWMAGVMAEFTVPIVNIGMDASLLYARQNLTKEQETTYDNKDFLDIPINLKWKIGLPVVGKVISPIIYTGPDFLFALNKHTISNIESKTCEVGWNLGIGVELLSHLQIQGGYCFGLNNVAKYVSSVNTMDLKAKKNYWSVTAAYLF